MLGSPEAYQETVITKLECTLGEIPANYRASRIEPCAARQSVHAQNVIINNEFIRGRTLSFKIKLML